MAAISRKRILISNDDGIGAKGLAILEAVARRLSDDVWVIAPDSERSGAGHSLTLSEPIRLHQHGEKRFSLSGTPTDCVMMALNKVMRDQPPTLILSGINRGGNIAEDVTYSGTVSVAMEGTLGHIPSVALSLCTRPNESVKWETAERYCAPLLEQLLSEAWPRDVLMNVNFPAIEADAVKGVHVTQMGWREIMGNNVEERIDPRGFPYYWFGLGREIGTLAHETDLKAVRTGYISVTPLHLDLTHQETRRALNKRLTQEF